MDHHLLQRHLLPLKADLVAQVKRVRDLREIVAALAGIGGDVTSNNARLRDAEATLAVYASEVVRLERELGTVTVV